MATDLRKSSSLAIPHRVRTEPDRLRIGLLGCGTVGSEVAMALLAPETRDRFRTSLARVSVAHLDKRRSVELEKGTLTADALSVVKDPDIDLIVELIGGIEFPSVLIRQALVEGKSVVTANKEVVALHGQELSAIAKERGAGFYFEGAVGGAVPMVAGISDALACDRVQCFAGVLNGTTNYVLSAVAKKGVAVADAIREAQDLGFAEADPSDDLGGSDAARKAAILATLAFGCRVHPADVYTRGIEDLCLEDILSARRLGFETKLLVAAEEYSGFLQVSVEPHAVEASHPLAGVDGSTNTLVVDSELAGRLVFTGPGAGGKETASAVLSDIRRASMALPGPEFRAEPGAPKILSRKDNPARFVVRCLSTDPHGSGLIEGCLFSHGIGVDRIESAGGYPREITVLTGIGERGCIERALSRLELDGVQCMSLLKVLEGR